MKNFRLYKVFFLYSLALLLNIAYVSAFKSSICSNFPPHNSTSLSSNSVSTFSIATHYINGTFLDIDKQTKEKIPSSKNMLSDSTEAPNTIKVWENATGDVMMTLKLKDKDQRIKITVWNMLGKIVIEDFEGDFKDLESQHILKDSNSLTRGAYLIRIQGDKCRLDAKFIKSR